MYNELKAGILLIQPTCQSMNCYPFSLAIPGLAAEIADINPILLSIVNSSFCDQRLLLEYQTDNQIHNNQLSVLNSQSDWAKPFLPVLKELVISWVDKSVEKNNNPMTPFQSALNNLFCLWASKKVKRCDYRQLLTVQTSTLELIRTEIESELLFFFHTYVSDCNPANIGSRITNIATAWNSDFFITTSFTFMRIKNCN